MKRSYRILPVYTGDVSGACAALYELGGMVVIHDPSGCNSTYNTHDETRWYHRDSLIFITGLSELDAILGNDEKLIRDVTDTARTLNPKFIALVNSPIPFLSGTDFPAVCRIIEANTGIPTFYVSTNGMHDYAAGAGRALAEIAARFVAPSARQPDSLNILGLTPLDFGAAGSEQSLRDYVRSAGFDLISCWAMGDGLEQLSRASGASVNLVVSALGLPAAKVLRERFGTPYVAGAPIGAFGDALTAALKLSAADGQNRFPCRDGRSPGDGAYTAIGEPVTMGSLAAATERASGKGFRVVSPLEGTAELLAPSDLQVDGEEEIEAALQSAEVVLGDPMYRLILTERARLCPLPHQAFSGRNGWKTVKNLMELDIPALLEV